VNAGYIDKLGRDASAKRAIDKMQKKGKSVHIPLSSRLLALDIITTPKVRLKVLENLIGIIFSWFLMEVRYPLKGFLSSITCCILYRRSLYRVLVKFSADVIILKGEEVKAQKKSLMCDKGNSRSTNDVEKNAPYVKLMGIFNLEKKKVNVFNFGMNTAGNCTIDAG